MKITNVVTWGIVIASGALAGCVGYDGGSDGASLTAQSLGLTQAEESRIRDALGRSALTAAEIARTEEDLAREGRMPSEWKTQALADVASARRTIADWGSCVGDINCVSGHCSQAGVCVPQAEFKAYGSSCQYSWECASNVCADVRKSVTIGGLTTTQTFRQCVMPRATDANGAKDNGETDVDCGGPNSPYSCPLGAVCATDDDCVAGYCISTKTSTVVSTSTGPKVVFTSRNQCQLQKGNTTDLGRAWPQANPYGSTLPYPKSVAVSRDLGASFQASAVRSKPQLYSGASKVAAESTRAFQHDTCVAHLIANGCSTVSVQTRSHRAAYDLMVCPQSARATATSTGVGAGIRIKLRETVNLPTAISPSWVDYGTESYRGSFSTDDDPFLCNHSFTRGVRLVSKAGPGVAAGIGAISALATDLSGTTSKWDGYAVSQLTSNERPKAIAWFDELQRYLLVNAACTNGRVYKNGVRQGTAPTLYGSSTDTRIKALCDRYTPWSVSRLTFQVGFPVADTLSADEIAFVKENVPWHNAFDVYSIDPEGNPYLPANLNMQYGWDVMHTGFTFADYASSWGVTLVPTTTTYSFGGSISTVWGTTSTAAFGWGI